MNNFIERDKAEEYISKIDEVYSILFELRMESVFPDTFIVPFSDSLYAKREELRKEVETFSKQFK